MILNPIPDEYPNPDCPKCQGDGVPQSIAHSFLADDYSNIACDECWPVIVAQDITDVAGTG